MSPHTQTPTNDLRRRGPSPPSFRAPPRRSKQAPKPIKALNKCYSDPLLDGLVGPCRSFGSGEVHTLDGLLLCGDSGSPQLAGSPLSQIYAGYGKDAKVAIKVTVEGSPGAIRTLVKLGTSVEDTIKLVIHKYGEEGRTPRLHKDAASSFDLHLSYFSLQCLERSNAIGDVGSRSFYLRKTNKKSNGENTLEVATTSLCNPSEIVHVQGSSPPKEPPPTMVTLPSLIQRKISKFVRRMHKLFKLLCCLHSL